MLSNEKNKKTKHSCIYKRNENTLKMMMINEKKKKIENKEKKYDKTTP